MRRSRKPFQGFKPLTRVRIPPPPSAEGDRRSDEASFTGGSGAIELYWLPLGAGGSFVRLNGRVYEAAAAALGRREPLELYHSALEVTVSDGTYVVEQTPVPDLRGESRGVVAVGAVGSRWAGRLRIFRYEVRVWRGGRIPDVAEAVDSPRAVAGGEEPARRLLEALPRVPTPVWGRDELRLGEMWNSNSVIAWALEQAGVDAAAVRPPAGGRAPGWAAGVALSRR